MSNEEQMRKEFESTLGKMNFVLDRDSFGEYRFGGTQDAWTSWQAATASKQREIDALNHQVLELSAMVENARRSALAAVEDLAIRAKLAEDDSLNISQFALDGLQKIISLSPSTALRDYVNEEVAKALGAALGRVAPHG